MSELTSMVNIGKEMEKKLISVGIESSEQLIAIGAKDALMLIPTYCSPFFYVSLPLTHLQ